MEEEPKPKRRETVIGEPLDTFSVAELQERIEQLKQEIARTEAMLRSKKASLDQAANFFRR